MGGIFLIVFRESLEACLVIGILLAFLSKAGLERLRTAIWVGAALAIAASLGVAGLFLGILGEFEGRAEQIFEASFMLLGAGLLTTLILWIDRGDIRHALEGRARARAGAGGWWGILLLVFTAILREGVETVIFLGASLRDSGGAPLFAALAGLAAAILLGFLVFAAGTKVRAFFAVTNVLLILFAAGLVASAVGELTEAGLLAPLVPALWKVGPPVTGTLGSLLKGLFGYNPSPSLAMVLAYAGFLSLVGALLLARRRSARRAKAGAAAPAREGKRP